MTHALGLHRGHAPPVQALQPGQPRGLLLQAADGQGAARRARQGHHRDHRLPVRGDPDLPADGRVREGQARRRRVPRHLRQGELLLRADGPRHRDRAAARRRTCSGSPGTWTSRSWPPTTCTTRTPRTPTRTRSCCACSPARRWPTRGASSSTPRTSTSSRRRRCGTCGGSSRRPATTRCSSPSGSTCTSPRAPTSCRGCPVPAGLHRGHLAARAGARRAAGALPGRRARGPHPAGRLRGRRHPGDGLPRVLPGHRRPGPLRQGQRHPGRPGPRLGGRLAGRLRAQHHRAGPDRAQPAVRALPQPRARLDARHRPRLRRAPARRHDPLRHREVRRGAGLADHHVRDDQGQAGGQGLGPGARLPVRHR